jgi:GTP-binding protein
LEDYDTIKRELERYDPSLLKKDQLIVLNKIDVKTSEQRNPENLKKLLGQQGLAVCALSALTGEGVDGLMAAFRRRFIENEGCSKDGQDQKGPSPTHQTGRCQGGQRSPDH